jgi:RNA recognition motif-containing protein
MSTIHVANLSPAIHGDMLTSIFAHFGAIVDIRLISGQGPANYAFVEFGAPDSAHKALAMTGQEFDGRALRVELSKAKGPAPPNPQAFGAELFVGGLAPSITGEALRRHFSRWGAVQEANVMTHRQTGVSKGFGFVRLQSADQARACVAGAPHVIDGRTLNVEPSNLGQAAGGGAPARPGAADFFAAALPAPPPAKRARGGSRGAGGAAGEGDGRGLCVRQLFDAGPSLEAYAQKVEADTHATCGAEAASFSYQSSRLTTNTFKVHR